MPNYLVELYRSDAAAESLQDSADRLIVSARELGGHGIPVRHIDTIFLPTDETCLHLLEAESEADVRAVARRAGIEVDRIVPAEQLVSRDRVIAPSGASIPVAAEGRSL